MASTRARCRRSRLPGTCASRSVPPFRASAALPAGPARAAASSAAPPTSIASARESRRVIRSLARRPRCRSRRRGGRRSSRGSARRSSASEVCMKGAQGGFVAHQVDVEVGPGRSAGLAGQPVRRRDPPSRRGSSKIEVLQRRSRREERHEEAGTGRRSRRSSPRTRSNGSPGCRAFSSTTSVSKYFTSSVDPELLAG